MLLIFLKVLIILNLIKTIPNRIVGLLLLTKPCKVE